MSHAKSPRTAAYTSDDNTEHFINHNLGTTNVNITVINQADGTVITPSFIDVMSANTIYIEIAPSAAIRGFVIGV